MDRQLDASVVVVGAGPVGLTLALDLAWRGVDVTVLETRRAGEPPNVKCNQVSARSMEIFRRLGLADKLRGDRAAGGLSQRRSCCISATGPELSRIRLPSRAGRMRGETGDDGWWPTAEHPHRINQLFLEPVLFAHAAAQPRIRILHRTRFETSPKVRTASPRSPRPRCRHALTLDQPLSGRLRRGELDCAQGDRRRVRRHPGAAARAIDLLPRARLRTCCRASPPGCISLNPRRCGTMMAIDGRETWLIHNFLYHGEAGLDSLDRDWAIRNILGVGPDFDYEVISKEDWIGRRLVASKFRDRRVFICGDAAHLWMPHAGFGMNAGIADAANLAWKLAAVLHGWAEPRLLDAYGRAPADHRPGLALHLRHPIPGLDAAPRVAADIERPDAVGEAARAGSAGKAYALDVQQQCCGGLNFGYFYDGSPIIAYDGEQRTAYTMGTFTSTTVPGCRAPHVWLGRRSLYDAMGAGFTLLRFDPTVAVAASSARPRSAPCRSRCSTSTMRRRRSSIAKARAGAPGPACRLARRRGAGRPARLVDLVRGAHVAA